MVASRVIGCPSGAFFPGGNLLQNARMQSGVLREFFGRAAIESVDQEKPSKSGARLVSSIKPARFVFAVGTASIILAVVTWARAQPSLFVLCAHRKMKFRQSLVIKNKDKFPSVGHTNKVPFGELYLSGRAGIRSAASRLLLWV